MMGILGLVAVVSGSVAWASENQANDGKLDLILNQSKEVPALLDVNNALPGDRGFAVYPLVNGGTVTGTLSVEIPEVKNSGSSGFEWADGSGDLGANIEIACFLDTNRDGKYTEMEPFYGTVGLVDAEQHSQFVTLDDCDGMEWETLLTFAPGENVDLYLLWRIPESVGNEIQGDSVNFDIKFILDQIR